MAQSDDEAYSALYDVQLQWRIAMLESRLRQIDEEALKRWHWLEITIEKFKIEK